MNLGKAIGGDKFGINTKRLPARRLPVQVIAQVLYYE
jgi:hypothetical protein